MRWLLVLVLFPLTGISGGISLEKDYKIELSKSEIREKLNDLEYKVMRKEGTESPGSYAGHNSKEEGIYVDKLSGEPLFSSTDKFDSGTGWPSFTQPISGKFVVEKKDYKLIWPRVEIRSKYGDNHLGHVFKDGPKPTGLRYCMNGIAMRFIPKEKLASEGYKDLYDKYFSR